jgi:hypothetical protein
MSDFIGRTAELQWLDQLYAARESAFVPISGRRPIGRRIFTRHTPRERGAKRSPVSWHSLDDFYE